MKQQVQIQSDRADQAAAKVVQVESKNSELQTKYVYSVFIT